MPHFKSTSKCRNLVIVLGDQLNFDSAAFDEFDPKQDSVWMAEVAEESTHVWTHKARIVIFLSAMRHFRDSLLRRKIGVLYRKKSDDLKAIQKQARRFRESLNPSTSAPKLAKK